MNRTAVWTAVAHLAPSERQWLRQPVRRAHELEEVPTQVGARHDFIAHAHACDRDREQSAEQAPPPPDGITPDQGQPLQAEEQLSQAPPPMPEEFSSLSLEEEGDGSESK